MTALTPYNTSTSFTVAWSGADTGGAAIKNYDVQVRDGTGGAWTDWRMATTSTSASYSGTSGHAYFFRARARDNAFNLEAWPADYDTTTYVDNQAPTTSVAALPATSPATFTVNWSGSDPGSSGIASYDVQVRDGGGAWTTWQSAVTSTSAPTPASPGTPTASAAGRAITPATWKLTPPALIPRPPSRARRRKPR